MTGYSTKDNVIRVELGPQPPRPPSSKWFNILLMLLVIGSIISFLSIIY